MVISNCPVCGALYRPNQRGMCSRCAELEDQRFEVVKRYLEDNPDATLDVLAADTGIEKAVVLRFIRSGRLVTRPQAGLTCERCGRPIETGVVCPRCAQEMTKEIRDLTANRGHRMHMHEPSGAKRITRK